MPAPSFRIGKQAWQWTPRGGTRGPTPRREETFFDSTAASGGTGSYLKPYNDLTQLNALTGDLRGRRLYLKRGSVFAGSIALSGAKDFSIREYGDSGARPVVSNWIAVSVTWTSAGSNNWYCSSASFGATDVSVRLNDYYAERRLSVAELSANNYERSTTGAAWPWTFFYDSGTSRVYVHTDGTDPNTMTVYRPRTSGENATDYSLSLANCEDVTIGTIDFTGGRKAVGLVSGGSRLQLLSTNLYGNGGDLADPQDLLNVVGTSLASPFQHLLIEGCDIGQGMSSYIGHAIELSWVRYATIRRNFVHDVPLCFVEHWESCRDITIEQNRVDAVGIFVNHRVGTTDGNAASHHQDILLRNNIFNQRFSNEYKGATGAGTRSGTGYRQYAGDAANFTNVRVINNTFLMEDGLAADLYNSGTAASGSRTMKFKNNLVIMKQSLAAASSFQRESCVYAANAAAATNSTIDYNLYQFGADQPAFALGGSFLTDFASYQAEWGVLTPATNEDHSAGATAAQNTIAVNSTMVASSFTPHASAIAAMFTADTADADYPSTDYFGVTRSRATIGACN